MKKPTLFGTLISSHIEETDGDTKFLKSAKIQSNSDKVQLLLYIHRDEA
jgi:hypothetical protein